MRDTVRRRGWWACALAAAVLLVGIAFGWSWTRGQVRELRHAQDAAIEAFDRLSGEAERR